MLSYDRAGSARYCTVVGRGVFTFQCRGGRWDVQESQVYSCIRAEDQASRDKRYKRVRDLPRATSDHHLKNSHYDLDLIDYCFGKKRQRKCPLFSWRRLFVLHENTNTGGFEAADGKIREVRVVQVAFVCYTVVRRRLSLHPYNNAHRSYALCKTDSIS